MTQLPQARTGDRLSTIVQMPLDIGSVRAGNVFDALETVVMERSGDRPRRIADFHVNGDLRYHFVFEKMGSFDQAHALVVGPRLDVFEIDPVQRYHVFGLATYPFSLPGVSSGTRPDEQTIRAYFTDIAELVRERLV